MADLPVSAPSVAGVNLNPAAASSGGDAILNTRGDVFLYVTNGGGSSINVTLAAVQTTRPADGTFPASTFGNQVVAVPNGQSRLIGPIPPAFNDANGKVQVTYSSVTSVTVAAFRPAA